ncbi:hypothetical protein Fmac_018067 [Flemingia macrophylla]|uniref:Myb-like domain-containing protein n=1 Tax=Flemingia macrophylla TaxID=520843 RepID=A0ABD1M407_9FABA
MSTAKINWSFEKMRGLAARLEKDHAESSPSGQAQFLKSPLNSLADNYRSSTPGLWTDHEHRLFLEGLLEVENLNIKRKWKYISSKIKSKSSSQVASHAQKYFLHQGNTPERNGKRKSIFCTTLEK